MLNADYREDYIRTFLTPFEALSGEQLGAELVGLEAEVRGRFAVNGISPAHTAAQFHAAMRYYGQEHTVKVPILPGDLTDNLVTLRRRLDTHHERAYSLALPESAAEIVNLQVSILGITSKPVLKRISANAAPESIKGKRNIAIRGYGAAISVAVYDRERLGADAEIQGPAIIEEWTSTTLILPDQSAAVDEYSNLIIKRVEP